LTHLVTSGLSKHKKTHQKESHYRCDVCHKNFKVQADLKSHCVNEHKNQITNCNVCKHQLNTGYSVYIHSMKHSGMRDYLCEECGQSFKSNNHLTNHKATHTPKGFECPICHKMLNQKRALEEHINKMHGEHADCLKGKYTCNLCDKSYKTEVNSLPNTGKFN
jgi:DNA-directed RNA polymerase subunit RPC12/RpoP